MVCKEENGLYCYVLIGNCFVMGDNFCDEGNVINDFYVEIIVKRGFKR